MSITGEPHDLLHVVVLREVTVDPIEEVEGAVRAERRDVVRGEVLDLALEIEGR